MTTTRQHGRKGTALEDAEAEIKRIENNRRSREARARKKVLEETQNKTYEDVLNLSQFQKDRICDKDGICPRDERIYIRCFNSNIKGRVVKRSYVMTMTGLNLSQIYIMQGRTGLIPYPKTTKKEAEASLIDFKW